MMEKGERPGPKAKGDRRYGRPVGAKWVRNCIGYLSALLGFAERKGWLPVNVARHVELPGKPESAEIRFRTAGRIRVRQNYVLGEFGTPKSRRSTRSVPMADEVAFVLALAAESGDQFDHCVERGL